MASGASVHRSLLSGSTPTKYTYTGQYDYAPQFGLQYYNARWYESSTGRFAQADAVVPSAVQGYDHYVYANNSPVVYNDPTGHCPLCIVVVFGGVEVTITAAELAFAAGLTILAIDAIAPGAQERHEAVASALASLASETSQTISQVPNVLFAKKSDVAWMDYMQGKYGLSDDQRDWLHQQMRQHGLTAEEIEDEAAEIQRENEAKEKENKPKKDEE
jgi:RHS repeat-associated protein